MADEENVTTAEQEAALNELAAEGQAMNPDAYAAPAQAETAAEPELTLTEKVAADEAGDAAKFAALSERVAKIETFLATSYNELVAHFDARVKALEGAAPAAANEKLEALVAKMHEKMKLLIPMD